MPQHVQTQIDRLNKLQEAIRSQAPKNEHTFRKIKKMAAADKTSFSGKSVQLYNPQYNFVSNPYAQMKKTETGSKLSLIAN